MQDRLQFISSGGTISTQQLHIRKALDNGAKWIQLRWKNADPFSHYRLAEEVKKYCDAYRATYIINDDIKLAHAVGADGVHLGLKDDTIADARAMLGKQKIIGGTANTIQDVMQRIQEGCDYIGLGPFRFTTTKENLSPILGATGYADIIRRLDHDGLSCPPIYAIGGIRLGDLALIRSIGIYGVAVSGLITDNPAGIKEIKEILNDRHEQFTNSR